MTYVSGLCFFAVVEVGPSHLELHVADFGVIHLVPPAVAGTVYRDPALESRVSSADDAVAVLEGLLSEVRASGVEVSPILERSRGSGTAGEPRSASTPVGERRGAPRASGSMEGGPASKRCR